MNATDLEHAIDRTLKRLPLPRAPHTLLPRVLAAVQEWSQRPWYRRAWFTWPVGWQVAAVGGAVLVASAGVVLLSTVQDAAAGATASLTARLTTTIATVAGSAGTAADAVQILWSGLGEPVLPYAFALVMLMCLACAAFGAVLNRVAFGRT